MVSRIELDGHHGREILCAKSSALTSIPAFLLNNTNQYWFAHAFGVAEYLVSSAFFPGKFSSGPWTSPVWSLGGMSAVLAESRNPQIHGPCANGALPSHRPPGWWSGITLPRHDPRVDLVLARRQSRQARRPRTYNPRRVRVSVFASAPASNQTASVILPRLTRSSGGRVTLHTRASSTGRSRRSCSSATLCPRRCSLWSWVASSRRGSRVSGSRRGVTFAHPADSCIPAFLHSSRAPLVHCYSAWGIRHRDQC